MVGNLTIQGQIVGTATFDGAKISAVVTIAPPINATVVFGKSGVTVHNELTGRDAVDVHPKESIKGLKLADSPEFANTQITKLDSVENEGVIPNVEATWLGATAKNVLSYLQKLVSKVFSIDGRVSAIEPKLIADWTAVSNTGLLVLTTYADGTPLNLKDGDVVDVQIYGKFASVNQAYVYLNGNSTLGQYQGYGKQLVGINYVAAPFSRASVIINFFTPQILASVSFTRSTGSGNGINSSSNNVVTTSTEDGGVINLPITSLSFSGTFLPGSRVVVKKVAL